MSAKQKPPEPTMNKSLSLILLSTLSLVAVACAAEADEDLAANEAEQRVRPTCPVPEPARQGAPYTVNASGTAKMTAWKASVAEYERTFGAKSAAAKAHAEEYTKVANAIGGKSCTDNSDCATGNAKFAGSCYRYVWVGNNGTCLVSDLAPVPGVPAAPSSPQFNCADVTCPAQFQCEVENSTGAAGCVAPRTCTPARPGGGGGGRNR
jgi:hypothetical protein